MKILHSPSSLLLASIALLVTLASHTPAQVLTVQVGTAAPPPTPLVNRGDTWHYRKGTSEPQADWRLAEDADLDGTWLTGPGGFGYADSDDATVLNDMLNGYNTVYIRRSFDIPVDTDPSRRVVLTMDWDDGFVAYLDGVEVARSPNVAVANPLFNSQTVAGQNHEASGGGGPAPTPYDLGSVGTLLAPGAHVLAVHGLNSDPASSDFSLIADLRLTGGASVAGGGPLFAIVNSATTPLSGTNTIAGATRVTVNGEEAAFNPATSEWSLNMPLSPGLNSLFVAALAADGALLAATNRDVFFRQSVVTMGGDVVGAPPFNAVTWAFGPSTVMVTNTITVKSGTYLLISNTLALLFAPGGSFKVEPGATVIVRDEGYNVHPGRPILFGPADGASLWDGIWAEGGSLQMEDCEVVAGQIVGTSNAGVFIHRSLFRDFYSGSRLLLAATNAASFTLRGSRLARYDQARFSGTRVLIDDCLIERIGSDATDFADSTNIVVRNTTYRYGSGSNTDAIDLGRNPGTLIEGVLIHGFPDKGVSIAGESHGTVVRNSLIFSNGFGMSAYAASNCVVENCTIANNTSGVALWERNAGQGAGHATGTNLIVWQNTTNVHRANGGTIDLNYSDVGGAVFPGTGNISADPLFVNSSAGNYLLGAGSPALGSGLGGVNMGASLPGGVGGLPPAPWNLQAVVAGTDNVRLFWLEDAANERGFEVWRSEGGIIATLPPDTTSYVDTTASLNVRYSYGVRALGKYSGLESRFSNIASAIRREPAAFVGGVLAANTAWSPALGTITVMSSLIVPSGITLTMLPGTVVKVTNDASIIAVGGVINIAGVADNKVRLMPLNGTSLWGELSGQFPGASLTVRHADISYAQVTVYSNAVGLLEDCFIHDYRRSSASLFIPPIILTHYAAPTTVRRCHVREYHETLWRNGILVIEECLFENISGDAVDFDSAQTGTVIRNCTFRHGTLGNVDAVDVGPGNIAGSFDVRIENCMMYDFPRDKGVSVGDNNSSRGTIVSNCFIYACLSGVQAKDLCDVSVRHCTIVNNNWGFTNYNKVNPTSPTGGGILTNCYNNILWNNGITISMVNGSRLYADHNDFGNTNWPGEGNFDLDPLFVNPSARDYGLTANSPCNETGRDSANMGAHFPVGSPMALSHPRIERIDSTGGNAIVRFWADNEKTYSLLSSPVADGGTWTKLVDVPLGTVPRFLSITNSLAPGSRFYRLVTPAQPPP
jgi:parallel beta-helix repeat protein